MDAPERLSGPPGRHGGFVHGEVGKGKAVRSDNLAVDVQHKGTVSNGIQQRHRHFVFQESLPSRQYVVSHTIRRI